MKNYPVIKFTLFFISGILIDKSIPITAHSYFVFFYALLLSLILTIYLNSKINYRLYVFIPVYLIVIISGVFTAEFQKPNFKFLPPDIEKQKDFRVYGTVSKVELRRESEIIFSLTADSITYPDTKLRIKTKLICRIHDENKKNIDSIYNKIMPGNYLTLMGLFVKGNNQRNPGEFDYNKFLAEQGISGVLYAYSVNEMNIMNPHDDKIQSIVFKVRKAIDNEISGLFKQQTAGFLRGQLLADRRSIDYNAIVEFINSGVVHILAVSGLSVGFIVIIVMMVFGRFNVYVRSILMIICVTIFLILTDFRAPTVRAVIMSILFTIGILTNRSTNGFNSLAVSAFIILLFDPAQLFDPGFQISFSAVLSILVLFPVFQKTINYFNIKIKWVNFVLLFIGLSLCAQIGSLPFTLFYFGKLSLVSLFANLLVIPIAGIIICTGIFTLILNLFIPVLASYFAAGIDLLNSLMFYIIKISGTSQYSFLRIRNFSLQDGIIFYVFLAILVYILFMFKSKIAIIISVALIIANIMVLCSLDNKNLLPDNYLHVLMIDVGQGDAFLLKFPDGETALVDAGSASLNYDNGERVILPLLNYLGIDKIDYGFVSHVDLDHYGGFISLINQDKITRIYKPYLDTSFSKDVKLEKFLKTMGIPVTHYEKEIINLPANRIYILNDFDRSVKLSTNNGSGVLKIVYSKNSILFTGDLEHKAEYHYLNDYGSFLKSDVLKVAHHGSKNGSSVEFISAVQPKISLISDGIKNKFGHPADIILQRLNQAGSIIERTDKTGAFLLRSDGDNIFAVDWRKF
jgi:competence protein ComEC